MLKRLSIKNVALIERLDMDFDNGLNVLTGETGAGKSIIIDAVNLALGKQGAHNHGGGKGVCRGGVRYRRRGSRKVHAAAE